MMSSASSRLSTNGFSISTGLPSSAARAAASWWFSSSVDTITAPTRSSEIAFLKSLVARSASADLASLSSFSGTMSQTARKFTCGIWWQEWALSVPIPPAPMTATPVSFIFYFRSFL
jgi:hypothetical protein